MECVPMVVWSLFIGSFLDNYKNGTKVVLLAGIVGDLFALIVYTGNVLFYDLSKSFNDDNITVLNRTFSHSRQILPVDRLNQCLVHRWTDQLFDDNLQLHCSKHK